MFSGWFGSSSAGNNGAAPATAASTGKHTSSSSGNERVVDSSSESAAARQKRLLETVFQSSIETLLLEATKHRSLAPLREVAHLARQHHYAPLELFHTFVLACDLCAHGKSTRHVLLQCLADIAKLASLGLMPINTQAVLTVCDLVRRLGLQMHRGTAAAEAESSGSPGEAESSAAPTGLSSVMNTTRLLVADEELLVRLGQLLTAFLSACPAESEAVRYVIGGLLLLYAGSDVHSMLEATCEVAITQKLVSIFQCLSADEEEGEERTRTHVDSHASGSIARQLRAVSLLRDVCGMAVGRPPQWVDLRLSLHVCDETVSTAARSGSRVGDGDDENTEDGEASAATNASAARATASTPVAPQHSALHPGIAFLDDDDSAELLRRDVSAAGVATAVKDNDVRGTQEGTGDEGDEGKRVPVALVEAAGETPRSVSVLPIKVASTPHRLRVLLMRALIQFFSGVAVGSSADADVSPAAATTTTTRTVFSVNPLLAQCLNENVVGLALDCSHYLDGVFVQQALQEQRMQLQLHNRRVLARRQGKFPAPPTPTVTPPAAGDDTEADERELDVFWVALVDFAAVENSVSDRQAGGRHSTPVPPPHASDESRTIARLVEQAEEQFILSQRLLVLSLTRYAPVMCRAAATVLAYHTGIIQESRTSGGTNAQATMIVLTLWKKALVEEGLLAHLLSIASVDPVAPPSTPAQAAPSTPSAHTDGTDSSADRRGDRRPAPFLSMVLECAAQLNEVMHAAEEATYRREEERRCVMRQDAAALARPNRVGTASSAGADGVAEDGGVATRDPSRAVSAAPSPLNKSLSPGLAPAVPRESGGDAGASPSGLAADMGALPAAARSASAVSSVAPTRTRATAPRRRRKLMLAHPALEYQQDLIGFLAVFGQSFARLVESAVKGSEAALRAAEGGVATTGAAATTSPTPSVPQLRDAFLHLHTALLRSTALSTRQMTEAGDDGLHLTLKAAAHWVQVCCLLQLRAERDLYLRALVAAMAFYNPLLAEPTDALCALQDECLARLALENEDPSAGLPATAGTAVGAGLHSGSGGDGTAVVNHSAKAQLKRWGGQFAHNMRRLTGLDAATAAAGTSHGDHPPRGTTALPAAMAGMGGGPVAASFMMENAGTGAAAAADHSHARRPASSSAPSSTVAGPAAVTGPITAHSVLTALAQRLASRASQEALRDGVRLLQRRLVMMKTLFSIGSTLGQALEASGWAILAEGFALVEWLAQRLDVLLHCLRDATAADEQRRQLGSDIGHLRDALRMMCLNSVSRLELSTLRAFFLALLDESVAAPARGARGVDCLGSDAHDVWRTPPPAASSADAPDDDAHAILCPDFVASDRATSEDRRCVAWEAQNRSSCFAQWRLLAECFGLVYLSLMRGSPAPVEGDHGGTVVVDPRLAPYAVVAWDATHTLYQRVVQRGHLVSWIQYFMRCPLHAALTTDVGARHARGATTTMTAMATSSTGGQAAGIARAGGARAGSRPAPAAAVAAASTATATTDFAEATAGVMGLLPAELRTLDDVLAGLLEDLVAMSAVGAVLAHRPDVLAQLPGVPSPRGDSLAASMVVAGSSGLGGELDAAATAREGEARIAAALASSAFATTSFAQLVARLVPFRRAELPYAPSLKATTATPHARTDTLAVGPLSLVDDLFAHFASWSVTSPLRRQASPPTSPLVFPAARTLHNLGGDTEGTDQPMECVGTGEAGLGVVTGRGHRLPLVILSTRVGTVILQGITQLVQAHSEDLRGDSWVPVIRVLQCTATSASRQGLVEPRVDGDKDDEDEDDLEEEESVRAAVMAELWPVVAPRLAQHAAEAVSQAFRVVEAIQHDVITILNVRGLIQLVRCVAAFMRYHIPQSDDVRLHINLSAVQLLWSLADYLAASDPPAASGEALWCTLWLQLFEGSIDARQEVRQSALKTFFAVVLTHGALFTGDSWRCILLGVLAPMMAIMLEGLPLCAIPPPPPTPPPSTDPSVAPPEAQQADLRSAAAAREAEVASRPRVSQAVAQVLQYSDHAQRLRMLTRNEADEEESVAEEVPCHTASPPPVTTSIIRGQESAPSTSSGAAGERRQGAVPSARVRQAQQELLRVLAASPKQLDEIRLSIMDGATRVFLAHADNMLAALARSAATTTTAPPGEGAALVEAVQSCFIQFCGEATVVVRDTTGEDVALGAVHALHGLMVESPMAGGLSVRCTALAWAALKRLVMRDASCCHTAKKQCTVNVIAGVEAALCDDVCLRRSLLLENGLSVGGFTHGEGSEGGGAAAPSSSPLLRRVASVVTPGARVSSALTGSFAGGGADTGKSGGGGGVASSWRRRLGAALTLTLPGATDPSDEAPRTASAGPVGSPLFARAAVVHRRGSAANSASTSSFPAVSASEGYAASLKAQFDDLVLVLQHCVRSDAVADAYFFPNKAQVTMVEGLQALWPLLSPAEGQAMLEAVLWPQFPSFEAVARFVGQGITTGTAPAADARSALSLRRCLPPGAHPNALLLYLQFALEVLTVPATAGGEADDLEVDEEEDATRFAATVAEHTHALQRLAAPALLRSVGHLLALQYASPAALAVHDPGTVTTLPDDFFPRVYDGFVRGVWEVAFGQSADAGPAAVGSSPEGVTTASPDAIAALAEVFAHHLTLASAATSHFELDAATAAMPPTVTAAVKTLGSLLDVLAHVIDSLVSTSDDVSSAAELLSAVALASSAHTTTLAPLAARSLQILRQYAAVELPATTSQDHSAVVAQPAPDAVDDAHARSGASRERLSDVVRASLAARNRAIMEQYRLKPRSEHAVSMLLESLQDVHDACVLVRQKRDDTSSALRTAGVHDAAAGGEVTLRQRRATASDTQSLEALVPDLLLLVGAVDDNPSARTDDEVAREKRVRGLVAQVLHEVFDTLRAVPRR